MTSSDINSLRIVHWPDPILTQCCREIEFPADVLPQLASKMLELVRPVGVGLAAPQVGLLVRMFVWSVDGDEGAVVNPILSDPAGDIALTEACLSLPDVAVEVRRPDGISMSGMSPDGTPLAPRRTDGLIARVWQHENDHLDGITLIQRMSAADRARNRPALRSLRLAAKRASRSKKGR